MGELLKSWHIEPLVWLFTAVGRKYWGIVALLVFYLATVAAVSAPESGMPEIRRYPPDVYDASPQNWVAVQDKKGILYFGNTDGVLMYNGVTWKLIPTQKNTAVRSLAIGEEGKIYVGGQSEFGYLETDSTGTLRFRSLVPKLRPQERDFTDVWNIYVLGGDVYFVSTERLFRLDHYGLMQSWKIPSSIFNSYVVDGRVLIDDRKTGLMELKNDALRPVPHASAFRKLNTCAILPYSGTVKLVVTDGQGLFLYDGTRLKPFKTAADSLLQKSEPYMGKYLDDGTYLIGTLNNGIINIDKSGRILHLLNKKNGLQGNAVLNVFEDHDRNLWVMHENGISRISWYSPFTHFSAPLYNLQTGITSITRYRHHLYLATGLGVYTLVGRYGDYERNQYAFVKVGGLEGPAWEVLPTSEALLAATSHGVYEVRGTHATLLYTGKAFTLYQPAGDSTTVFAGLANGIAILKRRGNGWKFAGRIEGIDREIRSIYQDSNGLLWMGTDYQGVIVADYRGGR